MNINELKDFLKNDEYEIKTGEIKDGDIILFKINDVLSLGAQKRLRESIKDILGDDFQNVKILVLKKEVILKF